MTWASWTTVRVFAGRGGVSTDTVGVITGELDVHTTWVDGEARVAVQHSGASDWFPMSGSPVPCSSEEASRVLHDAVVEAVRSGGGATVPRP
ncbi:MULTISPECIES: hypothetical protein [unclassified Streptomyces]|uniref:hypothetical protein n=1 Tax=unclassified Streptomyces TaxID=2593676 RepID=UPI0033A2A7C4